MSLASMLETKKPVIKPCDTRLHAIYTEIGDIAQRYIDIWNRRSYSNALEKLTILRHIQSRMWMYMCSSDPKEREIIFDQVVKYGLGKHDASYWIQLPHNASNSDTALLEKDRARLDVLLKWARADMITNIKQ